MRLRRFGFRRYMSASALRSSASTSSVGPRVQPTEAVRLTGAVFVGYWPVSAPRMESERSSTSPPAAARGMSTTNSSPPRR